MRSLKNTKLISILMVFSLGSVSWGGSIQVNSQMAETGRTLSFLSTQRTCDEQESWDCQTKISDRSGTLDISRCRGSEPIACYEDIKEICRERTSGRESTRSYRHFTGLCGNSYSDCW